MRITVNTDPLNSEQMKFLSQLGEFRDGHFWESGCDPEEFDEAGDWLKRAGIPGVIFEFDE